MCSKSGRSRRRTTFAGGMWRAATYSFAMKVEAQLSPFTTTMAFSGPPAANAEAVRHAMATASERRSFAEDGGAGKFPVRAGMGGGFHRRSRRKRKPPIEAERQWDMDRMPNRNDGVARPAFRCRAPLVGRTMTGCKIPRAHFIRSKFRCRICQSGTPASFARASVMSFASFAFFVGRFVLKNVPNIPGHGASHSL